MKCLLLVAILAGTVVSLQATCQQNFQNCKKAYDDGLPNTAGKPGALCLLGNTYISCLRNLAADTQECGDLANDITEARRKEEELLARNVSGCLLCTGEVDKCDEAFKNSVSQAGKNITAVCVAGYTMEQCLEKVDNRPECAPEKSRLEEERRTAQEKLNQAGCGSNGGCLVSFQTCQAQYAKESPTATTHAQQCKVASDYYNCLKALKCTGDYEKDLKAAEDSVFKEATATHCSLATGGAGVQSPSNPVTLLAYTFLAVAVTAKLY